MANKKDIENLQNQLDEAKTELELKNQVMMAQEEEIEKLKVRSTDAAHNPSIIRDRFDTREQTIVEEKERTLASVGDSGDALSQRELEVIDKPVSRSKLEELAFMEELITVKVHDTTDKNQVPVPPVWNDGKVQFFQRGQEQTVKRKYVERLARAKITTFTQRKEHDGAGNEVYVQVPHSALIYPFEIVEDKNPRGRDWLRGIVEEPH